MLKIFDAPSILHAYSWGVTKYKGKMTKYGMCGHIRAVINDKEYRHRSWLIHVGKNVLMIEAGWDLKGLATGRLYPTTGKFIGIKCSVW